MLRNVSYSEILLSSIYPVVCAKKSLIVGKDDEKQEINYIWIKHVEQLAKLLLNELGGLFQRYKKISVHCPTQKVRCLWFLKYYKYGIIITNTNSFSHLMPRSLVLGNGNMLATFDDRLQLRDFYYPYVGMEDHTTFGTFHRVGFFVDGQISWLCDKDWQISLGYLSNTLVGDSVAKNERLGLEVRFADFVYTTHDILFRKLTITNHVDREREIKVFFHYDFHIYEDKAKDTAQFEPEMNAVLHYRQDRYFLISGEWEQGGGLDQYAIGKTGYDGMEGTWRDAEDGLLQRNPIEQGSVDSTVGFRQIFLPHEEHTLFSWVVAGKRYDDIASGQQFVHQLGLEKIFSHATIFWQQWIKEKNTDFADLPAHLINLYNRSLLIVRTQTDNRGAILAANDSDNMKFNRDTYTYMWPRDGALVAMAFCDAGCEIQAERFFEFCQDVVTDEGFMLHKYNPDRTLGSSWHPKTRDNERQLPIQEDETALILVALHAFHQRFGKIEVMQQLFHPLILKMGDWMTKFIEPKTGLPIQTYDLWEEQRGVFSYTAACVFAGLRSAAALAKATGHLESAARFSQAATSLHRSILEHLYDKEAGRFLKKVVIKNGEIIERDATIDASLAFIWKMGVLPPEDKKVKSTMQAIVEQLTIPGNIGGIARYQNDNYHFDWDSLSHDQVTGNPWLITTLWHADYLISTAKNKTELESAKTILEWVFARANSAGILPEQVHPVTGAPLSVSPLTWSHATYIATIRAYANKFQSLKKA